MGGRALTKASSVSISCLAWIRELLIQIVKWRPDTVCFHTQAYGELSLWQPSFLFSYLYIMILTGWFCVWNYYLHQGDYIIIVVCLSVCLLATLLRNSWTDLHKIFREGWQWAFKQLIKFWWPFRWLSGYRDCCLDLSLLGDTESGINRLRCATLQCTSCTSRHRHSKYNVTTSPADDRQRDWCRNTGKTCLGRGVHCPSRCL